MLLEHDAQVDLRDDVRKLRLTEMYFVMVTELI